MAQLISTFTISGLYLAAIIGWCMNIWAIVFSVGGPLNALFVARCVGAFVAPLGALLGYF